MNSEPQEFKILKIGTQETFQSKFGPLVKYPLILEETGEEQVNQNKKPDSPPPKINEVLYGHIERNAFGATFKADQRPGGTTPNVRSDPTTSSDKFLKDITDLPARFIQSLLPYYDVQSLKPDTDQYFALMKLAKALANDAANLINEMRNPKVQNGQQPSDIKTKLDHGWSEKDQPDDMETE